MASNSSAEELHERAERFRRWADETDSSEMREAFLSLAASVTDRLLCSSQSPPRARHPAAWFSSRKVSMLRDPLNSVISRIDPWRQKNHNRPTAHLHPKGP
jgi:hypothetical protein